jgi:hypothetical protein
MAVNMPDQNISMSPNTAIILSGVLFQAIATEASNIFLIVRLIMSNLNSEPLLLLLSPVVPGAQSA